MCTCKRERENNEETYVRERENNEETYVCNASCMRVMKVYEEGNRGATNEGGSVLHDGGCSALRREVRLY